MPELNRTERRALLLGSLLIVVGAAARAGLGPGPAAYSWRAAPGGGGETTPGGLEAARSGAEAALAREERARTPLAPGEGVDPNRAPEEELRRLPGIGPARARAIAEARKEAAFRSADDLLRVPGIGPVVLERLADHLALPEAAGVPGDGGGRAGGSAGAGGTGPAPRPPPGTAGRLDLNRAGPEELESLPGIGPARARQIVLTRHRLGGFRSMEELLQVPGIGPRTLERLEAVARVR